MLAVLAATGDLYEHHAPGFSLHPPSTSQKPRLTATAVISLALGIGATTAVFSVIYAILMNPYAYAHSDRMVHMRLKDPSGQERFFGLTMGQWQEIRKSPVLEDAFLEDGWNLTISGQELPEDVSACLMSSNSFEFLGRRRTDPPQNPRS